MIILLDPYNQIKTSFLLFIHQLEQGPGAWRQVRLQQDRRGTPQHPQQEGPGRRPQEPAQPEEERSR